MPKTIQIRNLDDDVYAVLVWRAAQAGISVSELLRRRARIIAVEDPPSLTMKEWLDRARERRVNPNITREHILEALDEIRGPWPNAEAD